MNFVAPHGPRSVDYWHDVITPTESLFANRISYFAVEFIVDKSSIYSSIASGYGTALRDFGFLASIHLLEGKTQEILETE